MRDFSWRDHNSQMEVHDQTTDKEGLLQATDKMRSTECNSSCYVYLVGGLEHFIFSTLFHFIYGMSSDWRTPSFFSRWLGSTTNQLSLPHVPSKPTWVASIRSPRSEVWLWEYLSRSPISLHGDVRSGSKCILSGALAIEWHVFFNHPQKNWKYSKTL